jgi:hypothetical protein
LSAASASRWMSSRCGRQKRSQAMTHAPGVPFPQRRSVRRTPVPARGAPAGKVPQWEKCGRAEPCPGRTWPGD